MSGQKSNFLKYSLIAVACLIIVRMISMAVIPLFDPSECRYANICANMAHEDNFVEPKLIHRGEMTIFDGKPPLYFQMGGIACKVFGYNGFSVRFPAMFCGILILLMTLFTVRKLSDTDTAVRAFLLCAATPFFLVFCGVSLTDMTLCLSVTGAIYAYMLFASVSAESKLREKKFWSISFFFSLGLGMLAKGPVALVLAGMPVFLYVLIANRWRELRYHAWVLGPLVFLAVAAPWYWIMQSRDPDFLEYFFINENFKRFLFKNYGDKFGSGREFFHGMALLWFLVANALAVLLIIPVFFKKQSRSKLLSKRDFLDGNALVVLPILAMGSITLFWCLTSRIPSYYLLSTVPVTSVAITVLLTRTGSFDEPKYRKGFLIICFIFSLTTILGLFITSEVAQRTTKKMPQRAYAFVRELQKNDPRCKNRQAYILRLNPYSAEFYLGKDHFVWHDAEDPWQSLHNAGKENNILMLTEFDINENMEGYDPQNKSRHFPQRKLAGTFGIWRVYYPVEEPSAEKISVQSENLKK